MPGSDPGEDVPRWLERAVEALLGLVLAGGAVAVILLSLGAADSPLAGPLAWERRAEAGQCLEAGDLVLPPLVVPVSLVARARVTAPPADLTRWGVWLVAPDSGWRWEVLPPGYFLYGGETHPFFHVHTGTNELRLDLSPAGTVLWLNRERAWSAGDLPPDGLAWGLVGQDAVCWEQLAVYAPD